MDLVRIATAVTIFFLTSNALAIDIDNSDIPLVIVNSEGFPVGGECILDPFDAIDARDAGDWSPAKWLYPQAKNWSPSVMGARVGADGNIAVRFIMTTEDVNFFKNARFNGTDVRIPLALEIDVVDHNGAFGIPEVEDFVINEDNIPSAAGLIEDISNYDGNLKNLGAVIMHPAELQPDTVYQIVFNPDNNIKSTGIIHVNFQLTVNYKWIAAMVNGFSDKCDILDFMGNFRDDSISGYNIPVVNNPDFSNIPQEAIDPWYYYLAAVNDPSNKVGFELGRENHAVCWNNHENPNHDRSSYYGDNGQYDYLVSYNGEPIKDWCILDNNDVNLWRLGIGSKYYYNNTIVDGDGDGFGEQDDCNDSNHTIYPGAPEVCEDGIDQDCNGSDNACDLPPEIISPGTPSGGGMNDMKIKDVTLAKGANSERHSTLDQEPGEKFFAFVKIKNSGTAPAYDFKIKWYIDAGDRNFNREDKDYQGSIRIDQFNPGAEIRYSKELTSPTEEGIYWVYGCVTSIDNDEDESNNCSDEDDREEYGKLVVVNPYSGPIGTSTTPTGKTWSQLTAGEKAAVLQIILD